MPGEAYVDEQVLPRRRLEPGLLAQLALARPPAGPRRRRRSSPAGSSTKPRRPGGGTAAGTAPAPRRRRPAPPPRPGARATSRRNGSSSGARGGGSGPARSATTQSSRYRSARRDDRPRLGPVGERRPSAPVARGPAWPRSYRERREYGRPHDARSSLTQDEAAERAALLEVERYDIAVDLRGLLEGEVAGVDLDDHLHAAASPGAATFVDCVAEVAPRHAQRRRARPRPPSQTAGSRCPTSPPKRAGRRAAPADTGSGDGILRTVDPTDKLVYVWTPSSPTTPAGLWACFDQPDLKAPHGFTVQRAGRRGRSLSNCAPRARSTDRRRRRPGLDLPGHAAALDVRRRRQRRPVPRAARAARRPQPRPLLPPVARAATSSATPTSCSTLTEQGLAFFGEQFGAAVPAGALRPGLRAQHGRRDGELGLRHLGDSVLFRSTADPRAARRCVADVLLHEMAHMWFGDLVTMRGGTTCGSTRRSRRGPPPGRVAARHRVHRRLGDLPRRRQARRLPSRHGPGQPPDPRRRADVAQAMANFDAITYVKGQACSTSWWPTSARRPSSRACGPTSATTPGATPASTT